MPAPSPTTMPAMSLVRPKRLPDWPRCVSMINDALPSATTESHWGVWGSGPKTVASPLLAMQQGDTRNSENQGSDKKSKAWKTWQCKQCRKGHSRFIQRQGNQFLAEKYSWIAQLGLYHQPHPCLLNKASNVVSSVQPISKLLRGEPQRFDGAREQRWTKFAAARGSFQSCCSCPSSNQGVRVFVSMF